LQEVVTPAKAKNVKAMKRRKKIERIIKGDLKINEKVDFKVNQSYTNLLSHSTTHKHYTLYFLIQKKKII
jgi:hypothetical protein